MTPDEHSRGGPDMWARVREPGAPNAWMLPKLTDYWDPASGAINAHGQHLEALEQPELYAALDDIEAAVSDHVGALDDDLLLKGALVVSDYLYRSACAMDRWDDGLADYLGASAGTFMRSLSERGFMLQYVVDNHWDDLSRPLDLFPHWYEAACISYVCPQAIVPMLAEGDAEAEALDLGDQVPLFINEARHVAHKIVASCQEERRHLFHLDCDSAKGCFSSVERVRGDAGILTVCRNDAPGPDTTVQAWYPTALGQ